MSRDEMNKQAFREEAGDLLCELETSLLELEAAPDDAELIDRVFRAMHTIKGSGAMFGFEAIARFTHDLETVFDMVRNGEVPVTKELLDVTLAARDHIKRLLDGPDTLSGDDERQGQDIVRRLLALAPGANAAGPADQGGPGPEKAAAAEGREETICRIRFKPDADIHRSGTRPLALLDELSELGRVRATAHLGNIPALEECAPESCYVWWDLILITEEGVNAVRDVFIFVEDQSEISIEPIGKDGVLEDEAAYKRLGEILVDRGEIEPRELQKVLGEQKRLGELLIGAGAVTEDQVRAALVEQNAVRAAKRGRQADEGAASIRVAA
ncbi:MAG: Hpt domain-containing protein, partial [Desulfovibrionaceae bacterium]|nr:Hpt domain-containing protein [Desulfovibrionaceae bacterium]